MGYRCIFYNIYFCQDIIIYCGPVADKKIAIWALRVFNYVISVYVRRFTMGMKYPLQNEEVYKYISFFAPAQF